MYIGYSIQKQLDLVPCTANVFNHHSWLTSKMISLISPPWVHYEAIKYTYQAIYLFAIKQHLVFIVFALMYTIMVSTFWLTNSPDLSCIFFLIFQYFLKLSFIWSIASYFHGFCFSGWQPSLTSPVFLLNFQCRNFQILVKFPDFPLIFPYKWEPWQILLFVITQYVLSFFPVMETSKLDKPTNFIHLFDNLTFLSARFKSKNVNLLQRFCYKLFQFIRVLKLMRDFENQWTIYYERLSLPNWKMYGNAAFSGCILCAEIKR